ncbi:MAG: glutathione S-transferase family protein [Polyangiales bacterium]
MTKPKLSYFDAPVSRGEECRLALHLAGVDFEDHRFKREEWPALKATTPFGSVPVLEWPGQPPLAQSNAILVLVGRRHGLHPKDDFAAARHEAVMAHVEDLRQQIAPTMRIADEAEKKRVREQLVANYIPTWAAKVEQQIADDGPFFAGNAIHVVDLKLLMITRWIRSGVLDHIPKTAFDSAPKLLRVHDAVDAHPKVKAWYAQK